MLTCQEATQLLSTAQDRRLGLLERISLWRHLLICVLCRRYGRHLQFLSKAVRGNKDQLSGTRGVHLDDAARARIQKQLKKL